jgi:hypothetical protein
MDELQAICQRIRRETSEVERDVRRGKIPEDKAGEFLTARIMRDTERLAHELNKYICFEVLNKLGISASVAPFLVAGLYMAAFSIEEISTDSDLQRAQLREVAFGMATELFQDVELAFMHVPDGTMKGKPDV